MAHNLKEYICEHKKTRFVWGVNDCCTFASNWVEKSTGINPLKNLGFYGEYDHAEKAEEILDELGGLKHILDEALGESKHPSMAIQGDVVLGDIEYGETLGICLGTDCIFLGLRRPVFKKTLDMQLAWGV